MIGSGAGKQSSGCSLPRVATGTFCAGVVAVVVCAREEVVHVMTEGVAVSSVAVTLGVSSALFGGSGERDS